MTEPQSLLPESTDNANVCPVKIPPISKQLALLILQIMIFLNVKGTAYRYLLLSKWVPLS